MSKLNLSAECISTVVETLKAEAGVQKRWVKAADMLRAEGVTAETLNNDREYRDSFKKNVVLLSFTKTEQAIMAKPQTSLSDEEKVTKRWIQQQIGSRLNRVVQFVKRAEEEEALGDDEREARRVASLETRLKRDLAKWIDKVEKAEAVTFSATQMLQHLKAASAMLK
jgi:ABC-type hemin transport system substrate-binding protein